MFDFILSQIAIYINCVASYAATRTCLGPHYQPAVPLKLQNVKP